MSLVQIGRQFVISRATSHLFGSQDPAPAAVCPAVHMLACAGAAARLHPPSAADRLQRLGYAGSSGGSARRPLPRLPLPPAPPLPALTVPTRPQRGVLLVPAANGPSVDLNAAANMAESIFEATGVPLVDELMRFKTVEAAAQFAAQRAALVVGGALLGILLLKAIDRYFGRRIEKSGTSDFNIVGAAASAAFKPIQTMLPYMSGAYVLTVGAALAQVAAVKMKRDFYALCRGHGDKVLSTLKLFTQLLQDTSELLVIIFFAWAAVDFKNRVLRWVATNVLLASESETSAAFTLLRPLSGVLTFLIILAATGTALNAYGINLGPIWASVGGLGVVVGLASQRLMMNAFSAIALYSARPYVVGDEVHLLQGPRPQVKGTVIAVEPMRTIIHDDDGGVGK
ncbi:hypothetical protein ABPG77_005158 [Micractinium sp. CCAP 211/92]